MKVLVVVDMQNDFIDGVLGTKEASAIVPKVKEKIEYYRRNLNCIIFTRDTHDENYLNTNEGKNLPVEHCIKGTYGWQISDDLEISDSMVFDKPAFASVELAKYLTAFENVEEVELIGLCTDICVISNAFLLKAFLPRTQITVDSACCAGVTPQSHQNAIEAMKMCQIKCI